jgi:hypothetical protein
VFDRVVGWLNRLSQSSEVDAGVGTLMIDEKDNKVSGLRT